MKILYRTNWHTIGVLLFAIVLLYACNHATSTSRKATASRIKSDIEEGKLLIKAYIKEEVKSGGITLFEQPYDLWQDKSCTDEVIAQSKKINLVFENPIKYSAIDSIVWKSLVTIATKIIKEQSLRAYNSGPDEWVKLRKTGYEGYYTLSVPVFSKDYKSAMLFSDFNCGPRCGEGNLILFEKKNNIWVLIKKKRCWIV